MLCITFIAFFENKLNAQNQTLNGNITIGRQGDDCRGRGICSFTTNTKSEGNTTITFTKENNIIVLVKIDELSKIHQDKLSASLLNKTSDDDRYLFHMDEDFILPNNLRNLLKVNSSLTKISEGSYKMEVKEGNYCIIFKLE